MVRVFLTAGVMENGVSPARGKMELSVSSSLIGATVRRAVGLLAQSDGPRLVDCCCVDEPIT